MHTTVGALDKVRQVSPVTVAEPQQQDQELPSQHQLPLDWEPALVLERGRH